MTEYFYSNTYSLTSAGFLEQFSQNCSSPKYARKINSPVEASKSQQAQVLNTFFSLLIAYSLSGTTEMLNLICLLIYVS